MKLFADAAHARGLAAAQKNASELVGKKAQLGTDFAVAAECNTSDECGDYTAASCTVDSLHFADLTLGTWTIPCQAGNKYLSYQSRFIDGADGEVEVLWQAWDSTCTVLQYQDYQRQKITERVETPDATGTTISWRYDRLEEGLKPMQPGIVDVFNQSAVCGRADHQLGVYAQNLTGPGCRPATQYGLARIERTGSAQSLFAADAATGDGSTPASRPSAVNRAPAYTRTMDLRNTVANPKTPGSLRP
jgi:hypothetical protein